MDDISILEEIQDALEYKGGGRTIHDLMFFRDNELNLVTSRIRKEFTDDTRFLVFPFNADQSTRAQDYNEIREKVEQLVASSGVERSLLKLLVVVVTSSPGTVQLSMVTDKLKTYSLGVSVVEYLVTSGHGDDYLERAKQWKKQHQQRGYCNLM